MTPADRATAARENPLANCLPRSWGLLLYAARAAAFSRERWPRAEFVANGALNIAP